jgi:hypothetical protein
MLLAGLVLDRATLAHKEGMMESAATDGQRQSSEDDEPREGEKPRLLDDVAAGRIRPADAEPGSDEAAKLDDGEIGALDWILTAEKPPPWEVTVQSLTRDGFQPLVFVIEPQDGRKITDIEERNAKGKGPNRKLDEIGNDAELVAEATLFIEDPKTGRRIEPGSDEWRGPIPSKATAMEKRFAKQAGLLMGVAMEVRKISGYNSDHVGNARRRAVSDALVSAVGGS